MVNEKRRPRGAVQSKGYLITRNTTGSIYFPPATLSHAFGAALLAQYLRERKKDYHKRPRRNENKHARVRNLIVAFRKHIKNVGRAN
jgi:hypothetical protein